MTNETHREKLAALLVEFDATSRAAGSPRDANTLANWLESRGVTVGLLDELRRTREALRWALTELSDGPCDADGTPRHGCEFATNPLKGACDYHETYWKAWELADPNPENWPGGAARP